MSHVTAGFYAGFRHALGQLRVRMTLALATAGVGFGVVVAVAERVQSPWNAVDMALQGAGFGLVVPLVSMGVVSMVLGWNGLERGANAVAWLGVSRRVAAVSMVFVAACVAAVMGAVAAAVTALAAYGGVRAGVLADAGMALWIGALGGLVYGVYFGVASSFSKRGAAGRWCAFGADWLAGFFAGGVGLVFPKAHLRNLFGWPGMEACPQWASVLVLLLMVPFFTVVGLLRTRR